MNKKHYVPILKWKRAEQAALQALGDKEKKLLTPLIELVMPTVPFFKKIDKENSVKKSLDERSAEIVHKFKEKRIKEIPDEILQCWGTGPVFVDFTLLYDGDQLKIDSLNEIMSVGISKNLKIIPVLNLNDDANLKKSFISVVEKSNNGLCLRITQSDLSDVEALNKKIEAFLKDFKLNKNSIDLLIDLKEIQELGGKYMQSINWAQKIIDLSDWRNFIFASGAFPENLSECKLDEPKFLPRFDWQNWCDSIKSNKLTRTPVFADYAIRNPIFNEATQYYSSTPSIKYTLENDWLILKGKMNQSEHYLVNAKLLVEDMTDTFCGEAHCWGDKKIAEKAKYYHQYVSEVKSGKLKKGKGTGRSTDWIAWGINHHLMQVLNQIANLS